MIAQIREICAAMSDPNAEVEIPKADDLWKIIDNEMEPTDG